MKHEHTKENIAAALSPAEVPVYEFLDELDVDYELVRHEAFFTCDDVENSGLDLPGVHVKNLFVRDTRADKYYLVLLPWDERLDVKGYKEAVGWSRRIAFCGDEELMQYMGVTPGACSLFCMLNDKEKQVTLVVGRTIAAAAPEEKINFHPNDNRATVIMDVADMHRCVEAMGCPVIWVGPEEISE